MLGDPVIDPVTGLPQIAHPRRRARDRARRGAGRDDGAATRWAWRATSRLSEILFGETLKAGAEARTAHPNPPAHCARPRDDAQRRREARGHRVDGPGRPVLQRPVRRRRDARPITLSAGDCSRRTIQPILRPTARPAATRPAVHRARRVAAGTSFRGNRFVLTGSPEGDFGVTLSMISNTCNPASNYLLTRPSTVPHPARRRAGDRRCCRWAAPTTTRSRAGSRQAAATP